MSLLWPFSWFKRKRSDIHDQAVVEARTVTSAPVGIDASRDATAPLETCLMVPLAAAAPVDFVADAAVRAYLTTPASGGRLPSLPAESALKPSVSEAASVSADTGSIRDIAPSTASELDQQELRLKKRLQRPISSEPDIMPPSLAVNSVRVIHSLNVPEVATEMFAPLPAMPRTAARENPPLKPASPVPRPAPNVATPVSRIAEIPARPQRPVLDRAAPPSEANPAEQKIYQVQPPASSVVPAPHVRVPEPNESYNL